MAIKYPIQSQIESLVATRGYSISLNRISDLRKAVFGGRGGRNEELEYLRGNAGTAGVGVDTKVSDMWIRFGGTWTGGKVGKRADQAKRLTYENGSLE